MSSRSRYRNRGSPKRLRQIRMDRRSVWVLWILGVALLVALLWIMPWLAGHIEPE